MRIIYPSIFLARAESQKSNPSESTDEGLDFRKAELTSQVIDHCQRFADVGGNLDSEYRQQVFNELIQLVDKVIRIVPSQREEIVASVSRILGNYLNIVQMKSLPTVSEKINPGAPVPYQAFVKTTDSQPEEINQIFEHGGNAMSLNKKEFYRERPFEFKIDHTDSSCLHPVIFTFIPDPPNDGGLPLPPHTVIVDGAGKIVSLQAQIDEERLDDIIIYGEAADLERELEMYRFTLKTSGRSKRLRKQHLSKKTFDSPSKVARHFASSKSTSSSPPPNSLSDALPGTSSAVRAAKVRSLTSESFGNYSADKKTEQLLDDDEAEMELVHRMLVIDNEDEDEDELVTEPIAPSPNHGDFTVEDMNPFISNESASQIVSLPPPPNFGSRTPSGSLQALPEKDPAGIQGDQFRDYHRTLGKLRGTKRLREDGQITEEEYDEEEFERKSKKTRQE